MKKQLLALEPLGYLPHFLHADDLDWRETNCATDMWIEILHSWGLDPVAGLGFVVGTGFGGDQWTMFTYPEEDLRLLYGVEIHELNVWRPLIDHVEQQLDLGCLCMFDADAFFLPDTAGITYGLTHQKTTIAVQMIDREQGHLGYFHNAGYAELSGSDFRALFHLEDHADPLADAVPPFTLQIRMADGPMEVADLRRLTIERLRVHLDRRPMDNPVTALTKRMVEDLPDLVHEGMESFHRYAFGTCRHLGANAQLAAAFVDWLVSHDATVSRTQLGRAASGYRRISSGAKAAEFTLARAVSGRAVDLGSVMLPLQDAWESATAALVGAYGC